MVMLIYDLEDVEEEYAPNPNLFRSEDDSYLQVKRIELDSIIQQVGPKVFWKYIVHRLERVSCSKKL
jgi:hypothetical protein